MILHNLSSLQAGDSLGNCQAGGMKGEKLDSWTDVERSSSLTVVRSLSSSSSSSDKPTIPHLSSTKQRTDTVGDIKQLKSQRFFFRALAETKLGRWLADNHLADKNPCNCWKGKKYSKWP